MAEINSDLNKYLKEMINPNKTKFDINNHKFYEYDQKKKRLINTLAIWAFTSHEVEHV